MIEQPAILLFADLGWQTKNCFRETFGISGTLGRETSSEVVIVNQLRSALMRLNPGISSEALNLVSSQDNIVVKFI
jgi:type I restriction enzyme, R subunit